MKAEIEVPEGVNVSLTGKVFEVTGPLGTVKRDLGFMPVVSFSLKKNIVTIETPKEKKRDKMFLNTAQAHVKNLIEGVTKGYRLPATWVIHTVGPVWSGGNRNEDILLASCYQNSFKEAVRVGAATLAFPSISTGAYRFPLERAVRIALGETKSFLQANQSIKKIFFVCFGGEVFDKYQRITKEVFD